MNGAGLAAVGIGAALGAWLRWGLGILFNGVLPSLPLGTLIANLAGGFLVGMAVQFFLQHAMLPPEWRLFVITGFLGGLTTFSTFSAESVELLGTGQTGWAVAHIAAHLAGSVLCTILGMHALRWMTGA